MRNFAAARPAARSGPHGLRRVARATLLTMRFNIVSQNSPYPEEDAKGGRLEGWPRQDWPPCRCHATALSVAAITMISASAMAMPFGFGRRPGKPVGRFQQILHGVCDDPCHLLDESGIGLCPECPDSDRALRCRKILRCTDNAPLIRVRECPLRANSGHDEAVRSSRELDPKRTSQWLGSGQLARIIRRELYARDQRRSGHRAFSGDWRDGNRRYVG
jgi:hypothetical protein